MVKQTILLSTLAVVAIACFCKALLSDALQDHSYYQDTYRKMLKDACEPATYSEWLKIYGNLLEELKDARETQNQDHQFDVQDTIDYMFTAMQANSAEPCAEMLEKELRVLYARYGAQFPEDEE